MTRIKPSCVTMAVRRSTQPSMKGYQVTGQMKLQKSWLATPTRRPVMHIVLPQLPLRCASLYTLSAHDTNDFVKLDVSRKSLAYATLRPLSPPPHVWWIQIRAPHQHGSRYLWYHHQGHCVRRCEQAFRGTDGAWPPPRVEFEGLASSPSSRVLKFTSIIYRNVEIWCCVLSCPFPLTMWYHRIASPASRPCSHRSKALLLKSPSAVSLCNIWRVGLCLFP